MKSERKFKFKKRVDNVASVPENYSCSKGPWSLANSIVLPLPSQRDGHQYKVPHKVHQEAEFLKDQNILPRESSV